MAHLGSLLPTDGKLPNLTPAQTRGSNLLLVPSLHPYLGWLISSPRIAEGSANPPSFQQNLPAGPTADQGHGPGKMFSRENDVFRLRHLSDPLILLFVSPHDDLDGAYSKMAAHLQQPDIREVEIPLLEQFPQLYTVASLGQ